MLKLLQRQLRETAVQLQPLIRALEEIADNFDVAEQAAALIVSQARPEDAAGDAPEPARPHAVH